VKRSAEPVGEVPPVVVTVTSTVLALPDGAVAVIEVSEFTVTPVAALDPKSTAVAPVKSTPVIVTVVPPSVGPADGATKVTVGAVT
jgi:hypothetical protein